MPARHEASQDHASLVAGHLQHINFDQYASVNIKIGVLNVEARKQGELWIEFDPTVAAKTSSGQIILPYVASPFATDEVAFYLQAGAGCSSALMPSGLVVNMSHYLHAAKAACNRTVETLPPSEWGMWDEQHATEQQFRSTFDSAAHACYSCQTMQSVVGVRRFKAIKLKAVLDYVQKVHVLDIDAQGLDVALLLSIGDNIRKIQSIKIECQKPLRMNVNEGFLYHHVYAGQRVPANDCSAAERFVIQHGFRCKYKMNNCACVEYNMFCDRV